MFLETFQKSFFWLTCFSKSTFDDFCSASSYSKLSKCLICSFLCHICGLLCLICHFLCLFNCLICGCLCLFWCRICCLLGLKCYLQYLFCGLLCLFRCLFRMSPVVEFEGAILMGLYHFASRKKMTNHFFKNVSRILMKIHTIALFASLIICSVKVLRICVCFADLKGKNVQLSLDKIWKFRHSENRAKFV